VSNNPERLKNFIATHFLMQNQRCFIHSSQNLKQIPWTL